MIINQARKEGFHGTQRTSPKSATVHGLNDAIQKKKTELGFCDISKCENGSVAECVLVEGAPSVGKTTFAFELGKRWACGEVLQDCARMHVLLYHPYPKVGTQ